MEGLGFVLAWALLAGKVRTREFSRWAGFKGPSGRGLRHLLWAGPGGGARVGGPRPPSGVSRVWAGSFPGELCGAAGFVARGGNCGRV